MTLAKNGCYWRAKFRNLKVPVTGGVEIVRCELWMELRWAMWRPNLWTIVHLANGKPASMRLYTLINAKEACAQLFQEQLTPWTPYSVTGEPAELKSSAAPASKPA